MSDDLITSLRALAAAQHSDLTVAADAADRIERLTRERDEARKESDRLYTECGQLWDEYKKMCETIRTIGARCVELDDREAVSAILDIVEKVLEEDKP